jgi:hypothetical protein
VGRRSWGFFVAGLVGLFLVLMAWSLHRAAVGGSPVVKEYLRDHP